jgi:hypothetical protein
MELRIHHLHTILHARVLGKYDKTVEAFIILN